MVHIQTAEILKEIGEKIGEKRGSSQEKIKIAKNLLKLNIEINKIIEATGLSEKELINLKTQL